MDKLIVHLEFGKILTIISLVSILLTSLMYFIFKKDAKYDSVRYIPGFMFILVGIYNLFRLGIKIPDPNEFNRVLITVIFMTAGFVGILTGLIIGIITKGKKTKKH